MLFRQQCPRAPLDRFVESITYFEGYTPTHRRERVLPDGAVEIIVDLGEAPKRLYDDESGERCESFRGAWVSGMRRRFIVIEAAAEVSMAVIRFRPGGAFPFLGFDVEALNDTVSDLGAAIGTHSLRERILEADGADARLATIERWLIERAAGELEGNAVVEYLTGRLFAPAGIRIADVVAEVGYSQRHVLGIFRRWVGLSPKQFGRVRRFAQVMRHVSGGVATWEASGPVIDPIDEPDWADVAAHFGYADQPHLIRDFREFAGMTPTTYSARHRGLENFLPIE